MNSSKSNRKLLIFMSIFLLIVSSFVVADLLVNPSTFTFTGEPMDLKSDSFTLENTYVDHNITELNYVFNPSSSLSGSSITSESLNITNQISYIENDTGPVQINFDYELPEGLDAIDEDFETIIWTVGTIVITGEAIDPNTTSSVNYSLNVPLTIETQIENNLEFYNNEVEFEISGEDPINTSSGRTRTVEDGDRVTIRVFYENTFDEDISFDKNDIEVILYVDDVRQDTQDGKKNVDGDEVGEAELEFDVEDFDTGESYDVEIELTGFTDYNNGNGGRHGDTLSFKIEVEEAVEESTFVGDSDGDGVNDDLDLCPDTSILCISDEAGCEMDPDNDGICNGVDRTPNGEVVEEQTSQNTISRQAENNEEEPEVVEETVVKKDDESSGTGSFFFGLIVGFIGAALFFTLTKV